MNTKLELAFFIFAGIAILIGILWSVRTENRLKKFFAGKKAKDLEDHILRLEDSIARLHDTISKMETDLSEANKKLRKSLRGLEVIRFNPFPDQGSNQSFAVGMLNEDGDGMVLSSLYSRERMSVFAKPVKGGQSEFGLSNEEKEAIAKAQVK